MSFAAPWMLIGLIGLAVPVMIHLMARSRTAPVDWPTLRFLRIAKQVSAQRSRLKHLLVLLARLLLLTLLVLAMAKPYSQPREWGGRGDAPTTLAIVLDNSYSMGYREAGTAPSRFERAKSAALDEIKALTLDDEVALVLANEKASILTDRPTRDHQHVSRLVREAKLSSRGTNLEPALTAAFALAQLDALDAYYAKHSLE